MNYAKLLTYLSAAGFLGHALHQAVNQRDYAGAFQSVAAAAGLVGVSLPVHAAHEVFHA